ncbi:hypothetical protein ScPMuIL_005486 [Solemya velum]
MEDSLILVLAVFVGFSTGILLNNQVCYQGLGCFSSSSPFFSTHRLLSILPQSPTQIGTRFLLYTRLNPTASQEQPLVHDSVSGIARSNFDGRKPTKFVIHGFTHHAHRQWVQDMITELLRHEDVNVIAVDWENGAGTLYTQATANTRVVGAQTAQLILSLIANANSSALRTHVIGHSLGAHIAGYTGERVSGLSRITGLDPAEPYFQNTDVRVRLDPSDATFVDVIHTDGSSILSLGLGASQAMGHVDFYPNGGSNQPGCSKGLGNILGNTVWNAVSNLDYYAGEAALACSHMAANRFFTESINNECPFKAYPCVSAEEFAKGNCLVCPTGRCSTMGYHADKQTGRGSLYLETQASPPYCNYHYQVNITGDNGFDGTLTVGLNGNSGNSQKVAFMSKNVAIAEGHPISKLFKTTTNIGVLTGINLMYNKTDSFVLKYLYPETWQLRSTTVFSGLRQQKIRFCTSGQGVTNHQVATLAHRQGC